MRRRGTRLVSYGLWALGMFLPGCACGHNRQALYPNGPSPAVNSGGVRVRAPFVDVDVPTGTTYEAGPPILTPPRSEH